MRVRGAAQAASLAAAALLAFAVNAQERSQIDPTLTEVWKPVPPIVTPGRGNEAPSDAVVLFDGRDLSQWESVKGGPAKWTLGDGAFTVAKGTGDIRTKRGFGDCQLHVEWRAPAKVAGTGQERGNSGVYLQGRYEVQVLDSYDNVTYSNGQAASIYKQYIPLVNASRKPGEWQTYEIFFRAPRFAADGTVEKPAFVTVVHNGVLVQDHVEIKGATVYRGPPSYARHDAREPLVLQDHDTPVSYRNIWIREL